MSVRLIVGLGNPGDHYRHHRHNLGFRVIETLAERRGLTFRRTSPSYLVAGDGPEQDGLVLLKPRTYMNLSGQAISAWSRDSGVAVTGRRVPSFEEANPQGDDLRPGGETEAPPQDEAVRPLVVCDDLSLPLGSLRLRPRGSSGGQNGLASVIDHLGGEEFPRLRLGIAPLDREVDPAHWAEHVLAEFDSEEVDGADDLVATAAEAIEFWLDFGLESAIARFNRRVRPESRPE